MQKSQYEEIVRRFKGRRLVVLGDLMVDQYVTGDVNRISPESPVMVVEVGEETWVPGGAANVVNNLVALGAQVALLGIVGDDEAGSRLRADLAQRGVDVSGVLTDSSRPTTIKTRILAQHRQLLRVDREQTRPIDTSLANRLCQAFQAELDGAEAALISDYNKGVLTPEVGAWIVDAARKKGKLVAANPKPTTAERLRGIDVITLNQAEAEGLAGTKFTSETVLEQAGADLAAQLEIGVLVITRGAKGLTFWKRRAIPSARVETSPTTALQHVPAHAVDVYDVAGAGDTAISALTLALASGADIREAAIMANHAAACVVRKVGVETVSPEELLADWSQE